MAHSSFIASDQHVPPTLHDSVACSFTNLNAENGLASGG